MVPNFFYPRNSNEIQKIRHSVWVFCANLSFTYKIGRNFFDQNASKRKIFCQQNLSFFLGYGKKKFLEKRNNTRVIENDKHICFSKIFATEIGKIFVFFFFGYFPFFQFQKYLSYKKQKIMERKLL